MAAMLHLLAVWLATPARAALVGAPLAAGAGDHPAVVLPVAPLPGWICPPLHADNETFACAVAAGLLNRLYRRPAAVMQHNVGSNTYGNHDAAWLKVINQTNATVQATEYSSVDAAGMLAAAAKSGAAVAAVLYNISDWHALPTVLTLCGVHRAVPVQAPADAAALGLPVVFDARERWHTSLEATQFAVDQLLPHCSKKLFVLHYPRDLAGGDLADVVVGVEPPLFAIWPEDPYPVPASGPNKGKQLPNGPATICAVGSPTHELFVNLTEGKLGRQHGWAGPGPPERRIVSVLGYHQSGPGGGKSECISICTDAHRTVSLVGSFGGFHTWMPAIETMKQKSPVLDPGHFSPDLTYVALINSDGDNMGLDNTQLTQSTGLAERARICAAPGSLCPPIGWTMSNRLAEWAPAIFRWYYESATHADSFLLGPSGYGYIMPSMMDEADKGTLADATADAGRRFGMKGYVHWECTPNQFPGSQCTTASGYAKTPAFLKLMASKVSVGGPDVAFVAEKVVRSGLIGDGPAADKLAAIQELTGNWATNDYHGLGAGLASPITDPLKLAKALKAKPTGTIGYVYKIWSVNFTTVETLAAELNGSHVRLVDHRALKKLLVEKEEALGHSIPA